MSVFSIYKLTDKYFIKRIVIDITKPFSASCVSSSTQGRKFDACAEDVRDGFYEYTSI